MPGSLDLGEKFMTEQQPGNSLEQDIPYEVAFDAHRGTSFSPEKRADQERAGYAQTLTQDLADLTALANTDEKRATLAEEFKRYRAGYRERTLTELRAKARCVSTMIAGPARFPVDRQRKAGDVADRRVRDLLEYRERALAAIRKTLCPEDRPIMSGDEDAVERLKSNIEESEKLQERMKMVNVAIRKNLKTGPEAMLKAVVDVGFSPEAAAALTKREPGYEQGFPDYKIRNNGANIRRMKERLVALERAKAMPAKSIQGTGARVEDSPAENRVRLFFSCKPAAEIRERLKRGGWRWAPSVGAWSAYRNLNTIAMAAELVGAPTGVSIGAKTIS